MSQTGTAATAIPHGTMRRVEWETFARIAQNAAVTLPVEQTIVWDSFDADERARVPLLMGSARSGLVERGPH